MAKFLSLNNITENNSNNYIISMLQVNTSNKAILTSIALLGYIEIKFNEIL